MMRRRRGLVGAMATTAVVAGTAGAVRHHQEVKYANQAAQQQADSAAVQNQQEMADMQAQMAQMQAQQAQAAIAPAATAAPSLTDQLNSLAQMKNAGILNDAEFEAAKAKLLAG
jgi:putative oligomerization/nucleic acid binding protein